jgi:hypothetical protein
MFASLLMTSFVSLSKSRSVHEEWSCRLSLRRRGEDEGEGLDLSSGRVGCLDATLTLSLGKGEATHARTMSSVHQKSLSCLGDLNITGHSCDDFLAFQIFIEPRDSLLHSIDLMLRLDEEMAFARINDELCRHAERF